MTDYVIKATVQMLKVEAVVLDQIYLVREKDSNNKGVEKLMLKQVCYHTIINGAEIIKVADPYGNKIPGPGVLIEKSCLFYPAIVHGRDFLAQEQRKAIYYLHTDIFTELARLKKLNNSYLAKTRLDFLIKPCIDNGKICYYYAESLL